MRITHALIMSCLVAGMVAVPTFGDIMVDLQNDPTVGSQPGWQAFEVPLTNFNPVVAPTPNLPFVFVDAFGTDDVTLNMTTTADGFRARDRSADGTVTGTGIDEVLEDLWFINHSPGVSDQEMTATFSGIPAGDYTFSVWGNDAASGGWSGNVVDVDISGAGVVSSSGSTTYTVGDLPHSGTIAPGLVTFTADGVGDVSFRMSTPDSSVLVVSGYSLVPEPASLSLLGIGTLALLRRRR